MFRLFLDKFGRLERLKKSLFGHFFESQTKDVYRRVNLLRIGSRVAEFRVNDRIDHQAVCKFTQSLLGPIPPLGVGIQDIQEDICIDQHILTHRFGVRA